MGWPGIASGLSRARRAGCEAILCLAIRSVKTRFLKACHHWRSSGNWKKHELLQVIHARVYYRNQDFMMRFTKSWLHKILTSQNPDFTKSWFEICCFWKGCSVNLAVGQPYGELINSFLLRPQNHQKILPALEPELHHGWPAIDKKAQCLWYRWLCNDG